MGSQFATQRSRRSNCDLKELGVAIWRGYALGIQQSRTSLIKRGGSGSVEIDMEDDWDGFGGALQWRFGEPGICDLRGLGN